MECQMILVLKSYDFNVSFGKSNIKEFSGHDDLINYVHEKVKVVDSFFIYISDRHLDKLLESYIVDLKQLKKVIFYCDSLNDLKQAERQYHEKSAKFDFCLRTEVENRIRNILQTDDLNTQQPLDEEYWRGVFVDYIQEVQNQQQNLAVDTSSTSPQSNVGYNSRNISNIDQKFHCSSCLLILRTPIQLFCGHRLCTPCIESCKGDTIICPQCSEEALKNQAFFDKDFNNYMKCLPIQCSFCDWNGLLINYQDHLDQNHQNLIFNWCSTRFNSINNLETPERDECPMITRPCALKDYGCSHSVACAEMSDHYRSKQHQKAIIAYIFSDLPKSVIERPEGGSEIDVDNRPHTTTSPSGDINAKLKGIYETINILASESQCLNDDTQRLSSESIQSQASLDALTEEFAKLELSIREQNTYLDGLKPSQEILSQDVASLKQSIEDLQSVSYDGTYTWKISNVQEKMADAQSERQTWIDSPIFYSSRSGYKMRARLYLNGDGNARRTHMSLFFVLMPSKYDVILKFPFNYRVTFCLYDQSGAERHVIDSFRPDTKSNSFQRPRSEMNIASGISKFCPLSAIDQGNNSYVRGDIMFIKIRVDFDNTPSMVLPDVLGLNPGLPMHVESNYTNETVSNYHQDILIRHANEERQANSISRDILSNNNSPSSS